jgi:hypothetical protein
MRAIRLADSWPVVGTEAYQTPTEAVLLVGFMISWSVGCVLVLTNYRGWLDRYAAKIARSWWVRRVTGYSADTYRSLTQFVAVVGLAIALFTFVAEAFGVAKGHIR